MALATLESASLSEVFLTVILESIFTSLIHARLAVVKELFPSIPVVPNVWLQFYA